MNNPLISIIVPVYNVEAYVHRCLDSLINQTYRNIEILCVNDGSSDNSGPIIDEFQARDKRVKVIHQPNKGLAGARNTALDVMQGEWVTGVDADDYLELDTIEKAVAVVDDEVDIVSFGLQVVTDQGQGYNPYYDFKFFDKQAITREIILKTNVNFCAKLWRTSLIQSFNLRFIPGLWYEDNYFFYTLAPHARHIFFLDKKLYCRYMRADSIMGQTLAKTSKAIEQLKVREKILEFYRAHGLPAVLGEHSPSLFEAQLIKDGYNFCKRHLPSNEIKNLKLETLRIAKEFNLDCTSEILAEILPHSIFRDLFVKRTSDTVQYRFFGITFLKIQIKNGYKSVRILGIRILKMKIK